MTTWTAGDVSGSQTLTDNDHLYPAHINELRSTVNSLEDATSFAQDKIYCMGDSLTYNNVYETQLENDVGGWWTTVNKGISSETSAQMLARFNTDIISPGDAKYVVIWGAINSVMQDVTATSIEADLQAMYTMAHNAGIKVVAVNMSPFKGTAEWSAGRQAVLDGVNAWIAATAINVDYVIDVYSVLEDPGVPDTLLAAYDDGGHLHLTIAGYYAVGRAVYSGTTWTPTNRTPPTIIQQGGMVNGKIIPTVAADKLTISVKTLSGNDPSTTDPVWIRVHNRNVKVTSALTWGPLNNANYMNMGSTELASQGVDLFTYLVIHHHNNIGLALSRLPHGKMVADFTDGSTPTLDRCIADPDVTIDLTDNCENIGRFTAILSAAPNYLWSVPTFSASNLISSPTNESGWSTYQPVYGGSGSLTYTSVTTASAKYKVVGNTVYVQVVTSAGTTGGVTDATIRVSLPFKPIEGVTAGAMPVYNGSVQNVGPCSISTNGYFAQCADPAISNWALSAGVTLQISTFYRV